MRSQSKAEIKLLPISENGRPPYWNTTSGFDFGLIFVIGVSFYINLPNFIQIEPPLAELWRHIHIARWRPAAILDYTYVYMLSVTRILLVFLCLEVCMLLMITILFRATTCVWRLYAVMLKNKLRTTVAKELNVHLHVSFNNVLNHKCHI